MRNSYSYLFVLLLSGVSLFSSGCKKTVVKTTGNVVIHVAVPSCYSLYTEFSFGTNNTPLLDEKRYGGVVVVKETNKLTIEGLNAGNYVLVTCPNGARYVIQVGAGETRTYYF
jgi:hypothetical protein